MFAVRPRFRLQYFDRSVIRRNWNRINESPLKRSGFLVRRIARGSIRRGGKRKNPSRPGTPPRSHWPGATPPFKMIFSVPQRLDTSVIVGMVGFTKRAAGEPVPGLHEHGGRARRRVFRKGSEQRDAKGRFLRRKRFAEQAVVRYEPRPFMQPALEKARPRLPKLWEGSLTKAR